MVRTRHSIRSPYDSDIELLPAVTESGEIPRWMRQLKTDSKSAQLDDKKADGGLGVYTWKGAVYQIDENTPREWIEAEAHKHRKQERDNKAESSVRQQSESANSVKSAKQKSQEEALGKEPSSTKKRARGDEQQQQQENEDEEPERVAKKPRKSLSDKPAPPQRHYLFPSLGVKTKKRKPRSKRAPSQPESNRESRESSKLSQTNTNANESRESSNASNVNPGARQSRESSKAAVEQDETEEAAETSNADVYQDETEAGKSPQPPPDMPKFFDMPMTEQDKQEMSRLLSTVTEQEADELAAFMTKISRAYSHANEMRAHYDDLTETYEGLKQTLLATMKQMQQLQQTTPDSPMADRTSSLATKTGEPLDRIPCKRPISSPASANLSSKLPPSSSSSSLPKSHRHDTERGHSTSVDTIRRQGEAEIERIQKMRRELAILKSLPMLLDDFPMAATKSQKGGKEGGEG